MQQACSIGGCLLLGCLVWHAGAQTNNANGREGNAFGLRLPVDEVVITFHAADAHGLPVNDLKGDEVRLLDNGFAPGKILAFDVVLERPLHAGILMDTSESMFSDFPRIKAIAEEYAHRLFRQKSDRAFVMDFAYSSEFAQPSTSDSEVLTRSVRAVRAGTMSPIGGTALFDAIFRACLYGFDGGDRSATGNFIMLFSDGADNASRTSLEEALGACQRSNTAIYAFRTRASEETDTSGTVALAALATKTGGRLFHSDGDEQEISDDLNAIEADMRNEYRLVYRPANLTHDGSFHRIVVLTPDRVATVQVRSGYYAPAH